MEQLARVIIDGASLIKQVLTNLADADSSGAALNDTELWQDITSIVENFAGFLTQLVGEGIGRITAATPLT